MAPSLGTTGVLGCSGSAVEGMVFEEESGGVTEAKEDAGEVIRIVTGDTYDV